MFMQQCLTYIEYVAIICLAKVWRRIVLTEKSKQTGVIGFIEPENKYYHNNQTRFSYYHMSDYSKEFSAIKYSIWQQNYHFISS